MFAGKKSAQIREILISESAWEEMTCLFAPSIVGLVIATDKYQLVTIADENGERHWVPLSAGRISTKGDFPEEMHVSLSPQRLAATVTSEPQVIFLPDGEISRFTLTLQSYDKQHHFRVVSQGAAPVSVENDG